MEMNTHPDCIFSKQMVKELFGMSTHRINAAAQKIVSHQEHIENGHNCIAPLRAWCDVLRTIPKNPRPKKRK
jgi:hypothetical protein